MPHTPSAVKRARQNAQRKEKNRAAKSTLKTWSKRLMKALAAKDKKAPEIYKECCKILDQTASKGIIHKNTASRRKSRLAHQLQVKMGAKA